MMTRNTSWAFAGNGVYAACQWIVFVLLIRALGLEVVGVFAYSTAIAGPVFVLGNLRLRNLLATGDRSARSFSDFLLARVMTTALAVPVCLAIGTFLSPAPGSFAVLMLVAGARASEAISDIVHGLFQRELDIRSQAIGLVINGLLSVAFVATTLVISSSLVLATAGYAVASLAALLAWDWPRARRLTRERSADRRDGTPGGYPWPSAARAVHHITQAVPLGVSSAIGSVQSSLPRYVVAANLGPAALTIFTGIGYIPMIGHLVVNAASQAALPLLARAARAGSTDYWARLYRLVIAAVAWGLLGLGATVVFGRSVLVAIYGADYAGYHGVLIWLAVGSVATFASVFFGTGVTARRRFSIQPAISALSLAIVAITVVPLVRMYGLSGAAWSLCAAAIVEMGAYALLTVRDLKEQDARVTVVTGTLVEGARS